MSRDYVKTFQKFENEVVSYKTFYYTTINCSNASFGPLLIIPKNNIEGIAYEVAIIALRWN